MRRNHEPISVGRVMVLMMALLNAVVLKESFIAQNKGYGALYITVPLLVISVLFAYLKPVRISWTQQLRLKKREHLSTAMAAPSN